MKYRFLSPLIALSLFTSLVISCAQTEEITEEYIKKEFYIPMRDSIKLFTAVYVPKDTTQHYPILINRTPYGVRPYGDELKSSLGPSSILADEKYIFVYQDVRGRFMSYGKFVNMRPYQPDKTDSSQIDETTDTYDTVEWLLKNIPNNNGKAGIWGISYPGFYSSMGLIEAHPAVKAVSPQAPIADWFIGDDMHHNGAFSLVLNFNFFSTFGLPLKGLFKKWPPRFEHGTPDGYKFFLDLGPLANANKRYFKHEIDFWNKSMQHGTYDEFWQRRNILPHLKNVKPAVLTVGGWYDAEDLYGTLQTYAAIEKYNPENKAHLVMGPWAHGGWARMKGDWLGDIYFGSETSAFYQKQIEAHFFNFYLKERGDLSLPENYSFDTGINSWQTFENWPPENRRIHKIYLMDQQNLSLEKPKYSGNKYSDYISDPQNPVPFRQDISTAWGRAFMTADQRFASRRPDVLTFSSPILEDDLTLAGPVQAELFVSSSGSDADWVVKLVDVYPDSFTYEEPMETDTPMGGYQRLLRAEIMRSKFRNSYSTPQPLVPNEVTKIRFTLNDLFHTIKKGHRVMVQIQSSWFPLFDRNPHKFMDIYSAKEKDFVKAQQRIYHSARYPSNLTLGLLTEDK